MKKVRASHSLSTRAQIGVKAQNQLSFPPKSVLFCPLHTCKMLLWLQEQVISRVLLRVPDIPSWALANALYTSHGTSRPCASAFVSHLTYSLYSAIPETYLHCRRTLLNGYGIIAVASRSAVIRRRVSWANDEVGFLS